MSLHTFTTKITHRTNLTIIVKVVDLNINCIYNHNHMVAMSKISSSENVHKCMVTSQKHIQFESGLLHMCMNY
jgi:hypothetical protein